VPRLSLVVVENSVCLAQTGLADRTAQKPIDGTQMVQWRYGRSSKW
jgi:hypothetical protein